MRLGAGVGRSPRTGPHGAAIDDELGDVNRASAIRYASRLQHCLASKRGWSLSSGDYQIAVMQSSSRPRKRLPDFVDFLGLRVAVQVFFRRFLAWDHSLPIARRFEVVVWNRHRIVGDAGPE